VKNASIPLKLAYFCPKINKGFCKSAQNIGIKHFVIKQTPDIFCLPTHKVRINYFHNCPSFVNLKGSIILQHFAHRTLHMYEHRFKTLVSNGDHIYDERGNRSWNGMLFSSKKHSYLIVYSSHLFSLFQIKFSIPPTNILELTRWFKYHRVCLEQSVLTRYFDF
jgi:hypothetical protein